MIERFGWDDDNGEVVGRASHGLLALTSTTKLLLLLSCLRCLGCLFGEKDACCWCQGGGYSVALFETLNREGWQGVFKWKGRFRKKQDSATRRFVLAVEKSL